MPDDEKAPKRAEDKRAGAQRIADERARQVSTEGYDAKGFV